MKPFLALLGVLGGLVVAAGMFVGGVAVAMLLPDAEPERRLGAETEVADLWSGAPKRVDASAQDFERLPAAATALAKEETVADQADQKDAAAGGHWRASGEGEWTEVDAVTTSSATASLEAGLSGYETEPSSGSMPSAHVEWCSDRYRSYRAEENLYRSYSGELRTCVSPYMDTAVTASFEEEQDGMLDESVVTGDAIYLPEEAEMDVAISSDHVNDCFSRYRSYRPEDNSYQPFDGGPRRQCQ